jgi:predicted nicotinamide N-methyase
MKLLERSCSVTHELLLAEDADATLLIRERVASPSEDALGVTASEDTTGASVWGSAVVLARWLSEHKDELAGATVIELGAGCGIAGLAAASLGAAHVTLTDLNEATLTNLRHNVESNRNDVAGAVRVDRLDWSDPASWPSCCERAQLLLGADLLYDGAAAPLLAALARRLLKPGGAFLHCGPTHGRVGAGDLAPAMAAAGLVEEARAAPSADMLVSPLADADAAGEACAAHYRRLLTAETFVLQRFRHASFLAAASARAADAPLPDAYVRLADETMGPMERRLIAGNARVEAVDAAELLRELERGERLRHAVGPRSTLAYVPGVLSSAECARLRVFTEAALTRPDGQPWRTWGDSVDQELEWQLDLHDGRAELVELLSERAVARLWRLEGRLVANALHPVRGQRPIGLPRPPEGSGRSFTPRSAA